MRPHGIEPRSTATAHVLIGWRWRVMLRDHDDGGRALYVDGWRPTQRSAMRRAQTVFARLDRRFVHRNEWRSTCVTATRIDDGLRTSATVQARWVCEECLAPWAGGEQCWRCGNRTRMHGR